MRGVREDRGEHLTSGRREFMFRRALKVERRRLDNHGSVEVLKAFEGLSCKLYSIPFGIN